MPTISGILDRSISPLEVYIYISYCTVYYLFKILCETVGIIPQYIFFTQLFVKYNIVVKYKDVW